MKLYQEYFYINESAISHTTGGISLELRDQLRELIKSRKLARAALRKDYIQGGKIMDIYKTRYPEKLPAFKTKFKGWIEETRMEIEGIERNIGIIKGKIRAQIQTKRLGIQ